MKHFIIEKSKGPWKKKKTIAWPGSESSERAERRSSGKEYWPTAKTHKPNVKKMTDVEKIRALRELDSKVTN